MKLQTLGLHRRRGLRDSFKLGLEQLEARQLLAADVFISEFMASNDTSLLDEDGDTPDWIEIFNAGPESVNLDGWHLTDDPAKLRKWSFPEKELEPGNFLLVYASDKNRTESDQPLHTNFKLKSAGEYLALTRDTSITSVEVVSSFRPEYPFQFQDVSYGRSQGVTETVVQSADNAAKLFIPQNNALGTSWTSPTFDDNDWTSATGSIGYQTTVPGFTVEDAKSRGSIVNLTEATRVLDGTNQQSKTTEITPTVNFLDTGVSGNYGSDLEFPNNTNADDNDFAIRATGQIVIPRDGVWTFGINSDDGARLRVNRRTIINDNTLHAPQDTFGQIELEAGEYPIELLYFERGGGAEVELFAAQGSFTSFSASRFDLVGDTSNGGLAVYTSPSGTSTGFGAQFETDVSELMFDKSTDAYLRIPFQVDDPSSFDTLTLRTHYDDGFVAYLNGTEIGRRNAPEGVVPANAEATSDRPRLEASFSESLDVTPFLGELQAGENILAIHALNESISSDEFLMRAELVEVSVANGELLYFPNPTPREFNPSDGVEGFLTNEISFGTPHGFYDEAFELTITAATPETTIRYTLDGTEPNDNSTEYTGPITIDETTTIRARAFKDGLDPSFVETSTYLFIEDIVRQTRASATEVGFPSSSSVNSQSLDFGMDPDIVNSRVWGPQMEEALKQIPSLSVVMDADDLFGSREGIFVNAGSHGREWERPASMELINPDGGDGFHVNMGIRIRGGFSRSGGNPKHAFRLFFRDEYGDAKLEYPLFGDEGAEEFDKVDLRTTQNYSWAFRGSSRNAFVRDVFSRDLQRDMGQPYTRSRFYHLYLNGQYFGLFQTQERAEARYAASYFGGDSDDYDVVKSAGSSGGYQNEATDGTLEAYERLAAFFYQSGGLSDNNFDDYMRAQGKNPDGTRNPDYERLLDVENLMDYMIITYFTSDADGPGSKFTRPRVNNYFGIFNRANPDGFKFFEHDSEHSLDTGNAAGANYNMVSPFTTGGSQFRYFNPHWMHEQLARRNSEYRTQFMDRVVELTQPGGLLTPEKTLPIIDARAAQFDMAIIAESARWGDAKRNTPYTKSTWESAVRSTRSWLQQRVPTFLNQLRSVGWYPENSLPQFRVNDAPHDGNALEKSDRISFVVTTEDAEFNRNLIRPRVTWSYLDDGSDQGTAWREIDFDDSDWERDQTELGYGDGSEESVVGFGPNSNDKYVTTYFRRSFTLRDPEDITALRLRLQRDDGAVVYLNGQEIARSNMPSGDIKYDTGASSVVGGADETTFFEFNVDPALLQEGTNVMAVEIHQHIAGSGRVTSSDISFNLELLGTEADIDSTNSARTLYTTDGTDPRLLGGTQNPAAQELAEGGFTLAESSTVVARTFIGGVWGPAVSADFIVEEEDDLPGDTNQDGQLTESDINALAAAIRTNNSASRFDVNSDGNVNALDHSYLIEEIFETQPGDTNLDRIIDFADFLILSSNFGENDANWGEGDFDGDGEVGFTDFLLLSNNFGFDGN